jgi:DNA-binding transcriptional MerR regulator
MYTLGDLCGLADVTPRTVRYYIAQGLLRSPGTTGPGARYDDGHLARLRLIRRLQREHLPLAEIRARMAALTDEEALAQTEGPVEPPADSALDYVRGVLDGRSPRAPAGLTRRAAQPPPIVAHRAAMPSTGRRFAAAEDVTAFDAELAMPAAALSGPAAANASEPPVAERSTWERYALAPDVELHVRRPLTRSQNRAVARLLEAARQLLEEDQP